MTKYINHAAKLIVEHAVIHSAHHHLESIHRSNRVIDAAYKAANYGGYAEAGAIITSGFSRGIMAAVSSSLGGLAASSNYVGAGLAFSQVWAHYALLPFDALVNPYAYRNRNPEPRGITARFRDPGTRSKNDYRSSCFRPNGSNPTNGNNSGFLRSQYKSSSSTSYSASSSYRTSSSSGSSNRSNFGSTLRSQAQSARQSHVSGFLRSQFKSLSSAGHSTSGSTSREFRSVLRATGLVSSYNSTHPGSGIGSGGRRGEIGGVASSVGRITGLKDSVADVLFDEHLFCMPTVTGQLPFSDQQLKQIIRELAKGIYLQDAYPFFSLHFNNNSTMYPVLHPVYQNTLVGGVIGYLDYFMKGFLNGGIFDEEFLASWPSNPNIDREFLKSKLKDLKKLYKQNQQAYSSLREKMTKVGLELTPGQSIDENSFSVLNNKFRTSFRIIAKQKSIQQHNNLFLIDPDYEVKYSIDVLPEYQAYLDGYKSVHGKYPDDYLHLLRVYEQECEDIKEQMPKLPLFREYFQMLGVINFFCYYLSTLKDMGKLPALDKISLPATSAFPKEMPPIPVRYYKYYPTHIPFGDVWNSLLTQHKALLNKFLQDRLDKPQTELPFNIDSDIISILKACFAKQLPPQIMAEDDLMLAVTELQATVRTIIKSNAAAIRLTFHAAFKQIIEENELDTKIETLVSMPSMKDKIEALRKQVLKKLESHQAKMEEQFNQDMAKINKKIEDEKTKSINAMVAQINGQIPSLIQQEMAQIDAEGAQANAQIAQQIEQARQASIAEIEKQWNQLPHHIQRHNRKAHDDSINQCNAHYATQLQQHLSSIATQVAAAKANVSPRVHARCEAHKARKRQEIIKHYDGQKKILFDSNNESLTAGKSELVELKTHILKELDTLEANLADCTEIITTNQEIMSENLIEKLPVSTLEIADSAFYQQEGDNHRIVGGCGMRLPNQPVKPIQDGQQFIDAITPALGSKSTEQLVSVNINGQHYVAFKLKALQKPAYTLSDYSDIQDKVMTNAVAMGDNEYNALTELALELLDEEPATLPPFNPLAVDKEGQIVLHYLVQFGNLKQLEKVMDLNPASIRAADNHGNLPIHTAAIEGNVDAVKVLLMRDAFLIHAKNHNGATPLILAAEYGQTDVVEQLINANADINYALPNGLHALYLAIQNGQEQTALALIQKGKGLNFNAILDNGETSLHLAIEMKMSAVAKALLAAGADWSIKRKADDYTPFHCAVEQGMTEVCQAIHASGTLDINMPLSSGKTAVHLAAMNGHKDVLIWLTETCNANINSKTVLGESPLMLAIQQGYLEISHYLATRCELHVVNKLNQKASAYAAMLGQFSVMDVLLQRGENPRDSIYHLLQAGQYLRYKTLNPDPNLTFGSYTSLDIAAFFGHKELMDLLMSKKANFTLDNKTGWELIHYAVKSNHISFYQQWKKEQANKNCTVKSGHDQGKSLAFIAAEYGSLHCLQEILKTSSTQEIKQSFNDMHLLYGAVKSGKVKLVELVLKHCEDINISLDSKANKAIHIAAKFGSIKLIKHMNKRGVRLLEKNIEGHTCLHVAILNDDAYLLKKLLKLIPATEHPQDLIQFATDNKKRACLHVLGNSSPITKLKPKLTAEESAALAEKLSEALQNVDELEFEKLVKELVKSNTLDEIRIKYNYEELPVLHLAFKLEAEWAIKLLLDNKANPFVKDERGLTILHHLAKSSKKAAKRQMVLVDKYLELEKNVLIQEESDNGLSVFYLASLIDNNALMSAWITDETLVKQYVSQNGNSLLHQAVQMQNLGLVKSLLAKNIDVNSRNHRQITPLMMAAQAGNTPLVQLLLEHGADPSAKDLRQNTALHYAVEHKQQSVALQLMPVMKNVHSKNYQGMTPFMLAATQGLLPVLSGLIHIDSNCQHVNKHGLNALHLASLAGHADVIAYLSQQGFDLNAVQQPKQKNRMALNALQLAAKQGNIEACMMLIMLGADTTMEDEESNDLVDYLIASNKPAAMEIIELLNLEFKPHHLLTAAAHDNIRMLTELLLSGFDINYQDEFGRNALHRACAANASKAAALLIEQGIQVEQKSLGNNMPIHTAAGLGHVDCVRQLGASNIPMNKRNNDGETPLHLACEQGQYATVLQLLKSGTKLCKTDSSGLTAAQTAAKNGYFKIVEVLTIFGDHSLTRESIAQLPIHVRLELEKYPEQLEAINRIVQQRQSGRTVWQLTQETKNKEAEILIKEIRDLHLNRHSGFARQGNWQLALKEMQQCLAKGIEDFAIYYELGRSYAGIGNLAEAENAYAKSMEMAFEGVKYLVYYAKAQGYELLARDDLAEQAYLAMISLPGGKKYYAYESLGNICMKSNRPEDARRYYLQALELQPSQYCADSINSKLQSMPVSAPIEVNPNAFFQSDKTGEGKPHSLDVKAGM